MARTTAVTPSSSKSKVVMIVILYVMSIAIVLLGAGFCVYSAIHNVQLQVMTSTIPGFVFGMVILFLGVRYFMSLSKLRDEVMKSSGFSWANFRKEKKTK
jgi:cytochrome c biogenesis protein CcdA